MAMSTNHLHTACAKHAVTLLSMKMSQRQFGVAPGKR